MQKNTNSLASFNALYLHISEKVLTHTHTHILPGVDTFAALSYARAKQRAAPVNKGLTRVPSAP